MGIKATSLREEILVVMRRFLIAALGLACVAVAMPAMAQSQEGYHFDRRGLRPLNRPTPTPGAYPQGTSVMPRGGQGNYDPAAAEAIRTALDALRDYRGLLEDFDRARSEQERQGILANEEQLTAGALQAAFNAVADTRRNDPATRVMIYQIAKDALGSGNRSGVISQRIAYNVGALRKISVLQPY
jgi:hypothetical protein